MNEDLGSRVSTLEAENGVLKKKIDRLSRRTDQQHWDIARNGISAMAADAAARRSSQPPAL